MSSWSNFSQPIKMSLIQVKWVKKHLFSVRESSVTLGCFRSLLPQWYIYKLIALWSASTAGSQIASVGLKKAAWRSAGLSSNVLLMCCVAATSSGSRKLFMWLSAWLTLPDWWGSRGLGSRLKPRSPIGRSVCVKVRSTKKDRLVADRLTANRNAGW